MQIKRMKQFIYTYQGIIIYHDYVQHLCFVQILKKKIFITMFMVYMICIKHGNTRFTAKKLIQTRFQYNIILQYI